MFNTDRRGKKCTLDKMPPNEKTIVYLVLIQTHKPALDGILCLSTKSTTRLSKQKKKRLL